MVKTHGFRLRFSRENQSIYKWDNIFFKATKMGIQVGPKAVDSYDMGQ